MLNVIRYGGYNVGGKNYEEGGYLHEVPAISQFISGMIPVLVPSDSNQITVSLLNALTFRNEYSSYFCDTPNSAQITFQ